MTTIIHRHDIWFIVDIHTALLSVLKLLVHILGTCVYTFDPFMWGNILICQYARKTGKGDSFKKMYGLLGIWAPAIKKKYLNKKIEKKAPLPKICSLSLRGGSLKLNSAGEGLTIGRQTFFLFQSRRQTFFFLKIERQTFFYTLSFSAHRFLFPVAQLLWPLGWLRIRTYAGRWWNPSPGTRSPYTSGH